MKREIFWEAQQDSTSFPSGGHKIYHERSAIGDMLSAIHYEERKGLILRNQAFIHIQEDKLLAERDLIEINYIPAATENSLELLKEFLAPGTNGRDFLDYIKYGYCFF